jgi:hypothetical protein
MKRNNFYVYGHFDKAGNCFYIGKGTDRRAWSKDRHSVWIYYVETCLLNEYTVEIIKDGLTEDEAFLVESELISQYGKELINWQNEGRGFKREILDKFWELRNKNKALIEESKLLEKTDVEKSIDGYRKAILATSEYFDLDWEEDCLVKRISDMMDNEKEGRCKKGEIDAIDRLTLVLYKLGKKDEAKLEASNYFIKFPYDKTYKGYERIMKRINK